MRLVVALVLLAGCDKLFLQENDIPVDSGIDAPFDGPPPAGCPPEFANNRYYTITIKKTWVEAERTCRLLGYSFSHLAVVGDLSEALLIGPMINADAWIGLTSQGEPSLFHWITLEPAGFPWVANEPDGGGQCGRIQNDGMGVADTPCTETHHAVCECDDNIVVKSRF